MASNSAESGPPIIARIGVNGCDDQRLQLSNIGNRYKSFRFFFYSNEGNPREAMHVHVRSANGEAKFWLTPTVYLADSDGFDARTLRELRDAVIDNKELIERAWHEHFA
jgi:hypothetical protein